MYRIKSSCFSEEAALAGGRGGEGGGMQRILQQLLHTLNMDNWLSVCVLVGLQVACCLAYDGKRPQPPSCPVRGVLLALGSAAKYPFSVHPDCGP